jgi:hypothetical protein
VGKFGHFLTLVPSPLINFGRANSLAPASTHISDVIPVTLEKYIRVILLMIAHLSRCSVNDFTDSPKADLNNSIL